MPFGQMLKDLDEKKKKREEEKRAEREKREAEQTEQERKRELERQRHDSLKATLSTDDVVKHLKFIEEQNKEVIGQLDELEDRIDGMEDNLEDINLRDMIRSD